MICPIFGRAGFFICSVSLNVWFSTCLSCRFLVCMLVLEIVHLVTRPIWVHVQRKMEFSFVLSALWLTPWWPSNCFSSCHQFVPECIVKHFEWSRWQGTCFLFKADFQPLIVQQVLKLQNKGCFSKCQFCNTVYVVVCSHLQLLTPPHWKPHLQTFKLW